MSCGICGSHDHHDHTHVHGHAHGHVHAPGHGHHSHRHTSCCNPCNRVSSTNTAACESLPSQIQNFTTQFFGAVIKTEVDGEVTWSLPCDLDVGLENNPRAEGEGLACYFLRLFSEGIVGLTGPQGNPGSDGAAGRNAYTVTLASFVQPSLEQPNVQVVTSANPAILDDLYVFIATSGWYLVNEADPSGVLFLTLVKSVSGAGPIITAGKLVVPSGFPGASVQGQQGVQGPPGNPGTPGESFTAVNGVFSVPAGTNYDTQVAYAAVDFTSSTPQVLLPDEGSYLITAVVGVIGLATVAATDKVTFKLRNSSTSVDVTGSEKGISNIIEDEEKQVILNVIAETTGPNQTVALFGKATTSDKIAAVANATTISFVRIE